MSLVHVEASLHLFEALDKILDAQKKCDIEFTTDEYFELAGLRLQLLQAMYAKNKERRMEAQAKALGWDTPAVIEGEAV